MHTHTHARTITCCFVVLPFFQQSSQLRHLDLGEGSPNDLQGFSGGAVPEHRLLHALEVLRLEILLAPLLAGPGR